MIATDASNPFATRFVRPGAIAYQFFNGSDRDEALLQLAEQIANYRFSLIQGPHGTGKSTLIRSLAPLLNRRFGQVREVQLHSLSPWQRDSTRYRHASTNRALVFSELKHLGRSDLLVIDGVEQLAWYDVLRVRWYAQAKAVHVLATSHRPIQGFQSLRNTTLSPDQMEALTDQRLSGLSDQVKKTIRNHLATRTSTTAANLRECWFECYDILEHLRRQYGNSTHRGDGPITASK
ncbi:AAA family ATPase [Novipirellula artificiosorum]|uniref:Putative ribosome biogenesis GTPase RsgA n=1 Tax=Novipirellula artificiosorum TaxID=2528016 RepID=A0A5C6DEN5_9BACT|nr:AAA family ATPase [Novipirellula artificiosorum]TWU34201.1 putative ribosome biogenesis GTPase RsgA [Novipirellula artificiosorum]